jgi:hypothetical protein
VQEFRLNDPYLYLDRNSDCLIITVGDSWTWGDSLGTLALDPLKDDKEARFNNLYGRVISDYHNADWLNFGICAAGNASSLNTLSDWLLGNHYFFCGQESYEQIKDKSWPKTVTEFLHNNKKMKEFINHTKSINPFTKMIQSKKYKKIKVFFTLTESGRDIYFHLARNDINFLSVEDYLDFEENWTYQSIDFIRSHCDIEFYAGRNFTVDLPITENSCVGKDDIWIKKTFFQNQQEDFHNHTYAVDDILVSGCASGIALNLLKQIKIKGYKQYISDQISKADKLWYWLKNNPLHNNRATCHPNEKSHKLWAEYMLEKANV